MNLSDLKPAIGSTKRRKVVGRGPGSGHGKTSGRGHKGDKARGSSKVGFEGGQTPLHRRLPKQRGIGTGLTSVGFNTGKFKQKFTVVNIGELSHHFRPNDEVNLYQMRERGLIRGDKDLPIKVLGNGHLTIPLRVKAHRFSGAARKAIEGVGGVAVEAVPSSRPPGTAVFIIRPDKIPSDRFRSVGTGKEEGGVFVHLLYGRVTQIRRDEDIATIQLQGEQSVYMYYHDNLKATETALGRALQIGQVLQCRFFKTPRRTEQQVEIDVIKAADRIAELSVDEAEDLIRYYNEHKSVERVQWDEDTLGEDDWDDHN